MLRKIEYITYRNQYCENLIEVFDIKGNLISRKTAMNSFSQTLSFHDKRAGIYLVKWTQKGELQAVRKVVLSE